MSAAALVVIVTHGDEDFIGVETMTKTNYLHAQVQQNKQPLVDNNIDDCLNWLARKKPHTHAVCSV